MNSHDRKKTLYEANAQSVCPWKFGPWKFGTSRGGFGYCGAARRMLQSNIGRDKDVKSKPNKHIRFLFRAGAAIIRITAPLFKKPSGACRGIAIYMYSDKKNKKWCSGQVERLCQSIEALSRLEAFGKLRCILMTDDAPSNTDQYVARFCYSVLFLKRLNGFTDQNQILSALLLDYSIRAIALDEGCEASAMKKRGLDSAMAYLDEQDATGEMSVKYRGMRKFLE